MIDTIKTTAETNKAIALAGTLFTTGGALCYCLFKIHMLRNM